MFKSLRNQRGMSIPELLISTTIVGSLTMGSVPIYTNYINVAKAAEAPSFMGVLRTYAIGYCQAHGDYPKDGSWVKDFIGEQSTYFEYKFEYTPESPKIVAIGKIAPFTENDKLIYLLKQNRWEATGKLNDAKPTSAAS